MDDFFVRLWEFVWAVITNWFWWVTAVPFFLDQLLSKNFWSSDAVRRISELWPEENRHRFFKWVALVGFVVSCFMAFDHVNSELKSKQAELTELLKKKGQRDPAIVQQLQKYYSEASSFARIIGSNMQAASDDQFAGLEKQFETWANAMGEWLRKNMGEGAYNRVAQPAGGINPVYDGVNIKRSGFFNVVLNVQNNLKALVESSAWDRQQ